VDLLVLLEELEFFAEGRHSSSQVREDVGFFDAVVHRQMRAEGEAARQELPQCRSGRPGRRLAGVVEGGPFSPEVVVLCGLLAGGREMGRGTCKAVHEFGQPVVRCKLGGGEWRERGGRVWCLGGRGLRRGSHCPGVEGGS
jgi:hypothetical protein